MIVEKPEQNIGQPRLLETKGKVAAKKLATHF
jgi:hypothetical protein